MRRSFGYSGTRSGGQPARAGPFIKDSLSPSWLVTLLNRQLGVEASWPRLDDWPTVTIPLDLPACGGLCGEAVRGGMETTHTAMKNRKNSRPKGLGKNVGGGYTLRPQGFPKVSPYPFC